MQWLLSKIIDNPAVLVSIYAAVISTITLVWNIVNCLLDKTSRIEVEAEFKKTMIFDGIEQAIQGPEFLEVSVVNKSKKVKYIKIPQLKLSYSHEVYINNKDKNMVNLFIKGDKKVYPLALQSESETFFKYPFSDGFEWALKNAKDKDKFKVVITDTTKKQYLSNKISIK